MFQRRRQSHPLRVVCLAIFIAALPPTTVVAACDSAGAVDIRPRHPGPADRISYSVALPLEVSQVKPPVRVWTNAVVNFRSLDITVYITDAATNFPGAPPATPYPYAEIMGSVGPLTTGEYVARAAVLQFDAARNDFVELCPPTKVTPFTVSPEPGGTQSGLVVEFYNATLDHYFLTQDSEEIASLDKGRVWARTGYSFLAYLPGGSDARGQPVRRYYGLPSSHLDSHFFTWNLLEFQTLDLGVLSQDWIKETDDAFEIVVPDLSTGHCPLGTYPIYRLWNQRTDSAHRFTTSLAVRDEMVGKGYVVEGFGENAVAMCALSL